MNVWFGNIRGLFPKSYNTKVKAIECMAEMTKSKVMCLCESHLNEDIGDCEISIEGFECHRSDRIDRSHGGVIMYTDKRLASVCVLKWSNSQ